MRELRDQCQEQGQTVGLLTQRLSDARGAVTAELRSAASVRDALEGELQSEESQRRALQAAHQGEEAEIAGRVESAQQQFATMAAVRESLEAQLQTSARIQNELREHIAAERAGRVELEVAGEREMAAWREHNARMLSMGEMEASMQEAVPWDDAGASAVDVAALQEEAAENEREEVRLVDQLRRVRARQEASRQKLRAEVAAWRWEAERLRGQLSEANEEHQQSELAVQRHHAALGAAGCERDLLEEEFHARAEARAEQSRTSAHAEQMVEEANSSELERLRRLTGELHAELDELREHIDDCRNDEEAQMLRSERDEMLRQVQLETRRQAELRDELENEKKSWGFMCLRGRRTLQSPSPSPTAEPHRVPRQQSPAVASSQSVAEAFPVGCTVRTMDSAQMRTGEDLNSDKLQELLPGQLCEVVQRGSGRRLLVRDISSGDTGWISCATRDGQRLIAVVSTQDRFGAASPPSGGTRRLDRDAEQPPRALDLTDQV